MPVDPYHPAGTDDLPEIKTGNGVDRDLAATTNDRLKKNVWEMRILNSTMSEVVSQLKTNNKSEQETILELRDLNAILSAVLEQQKETTIASEKTTTALDNLTSTIKKLDKKNGRLQWMIIALTVATVGLAYVQVWVAFHPPQTPQPQIIVKEVPVKTK